MFKESTKRLSRRISKKPSIVCNPLSNNSIESFLYELCILKLKIEGRDKLVLKVLVLALLWTKYSLFFKNKSN